MSLSFGSELFRPRGTSSGLFVGSVAHKVWHGAQAHPSHQCIDWSLSGMSPWGQRTGHDAHAECGRKITPDVAGIFVLNLGPFRIIRETIRIRFSVCHLLLALQLPDRKISQRQPFLRKFGTFASGVAGNHQHKIVS